VSVATHEAENSRAMLAPTPRALLRLVRRAIEAHAEYRVKSAVPAAKLQRADREMQRYRRLIRAGR
jgi:hypothetical protein